MWVVFRKWKCAKEVFAQFENNCRVWQKGWRRCRCKMHSKGCVYETTPKTYAQKARKLINNAKRSNNVLQLQELTYACYQMWCGAVQKMNGQKSTNKTPVITKWLNSYEAQTCEFAPLFRQKTQEKQNILGETQTTSVVSRTTSAIKLFLVSRACFEDKLSRNQVQGVTLTIQLFYKTAGD